MKILATDTFQQQLKTILQEYAKEDFEATKKYKIYLDTVLINIPTKAQKYKKSLYFDDENIRDVQHQGLVIPFYMDEKTDTYILLGAVKK
jgi:hypothetical protein